MLKKALCKNMVHGYLCHRDAIWAAIRELKTFESKQLWAFVNAGSRRPKGVVKQAKETSIKRIQSYLNGLTVAGYLELDVSKQLSGNKRTGIHRWTLIKDVGIDAPRVTVQGEKVTIGKTFKHMWQGIKILKEFNWLELKHTATTKDAPIADSEVREYIRNLHKAGYLISAGKKTGQPTRYRLLPTRYTGPKPPMKQRVTQIFDANLGEVVWPKGDEK